jgi:hypothetical protein
MRISLLPVAGLSLLTLTACETTDPDLGYSVRQAVVSQAVDMNPNYAGLPIEGSSGVRALDAQRRYLKGVPRPLAKVDAKGNEAAGDSGAEGAGRAAPGAAAAAGPGNSN